MTGVSQPKLAVWKLAAFGRGCYGCFGPVADPNLPALVAQLRQLAVTEDEVDRVFATFNAASPALAPAYQR